VAHTPNIHINVALPEEKYFVGTDGPRVKVYLISTLNTFYVR
jgi:hypothetical protein